MSRKILVSTIIFLTILAILTVLFLLQLNTARQQLTLSEFTHATTIAEIQSTLAIKIQNHSTAEAENEMVQATAEKEIEIQATKQAETDAYVQEVEERYQAALAQKLGVQAQLRLSDTVDPTLGMLLATESLQRFHSVEGDVAIRRGIELMSWRQVFTSSDHGDCVRSISLSADGQRLGTLSSGCRYETDGVEIKVWEVNTNQEIVRLTPDHDEFPARGIDLSADGDWLIIYLWGNYEGPHITKVVAVDTSQQITHTVSSDAVFNPESKQLALINDDDTVVIWDIATQQVSGNLVHDHKVTSANFSPDGERIITYGEDNAWLWDSNTNELIYEIPFKNSWVRFSPDGRLLAIIDRDSSIVRIWEVDTWREIAQVGYGLSLYEVEFSPDGRWLATLSRGGDMQVWETSNGTEVNHIPLGSNRTSTMAFSPDGQWLATSPIGDKIQLWETGTWRESARIPKQGYILDFSADGKWLASNGDNYDPAKVWRLESGSEIARFYGVEKYSSLAFSNDGQYLAAQRTGEDKESIQTWNILTKEEVEQSELNETESASFVFDSDKQLKIAQGESGTIVISNTITNREVSRMVCADEIAADIIDFNQWISLPGQTIALNAEKDLLAVGGVLKEDEFYRNAVQLWDVSKCQERSQLLHNYSIAQMAFSPNGKLLAVGTNQIWVDWKGVGEIRIWDVATGQELVFIDSGQVWSMFFSSDSRWIVVNGNRIFETASGREVTRISNRSASLAAFSPDNRWLATGGLIPLYDEHISVWAWQPADLIALACARVNRNLTKEEWKLYLGNEPYRATCPNLLTP